VNEIICGCDIYIPNGFTPDNDGLNDYFFPEFHCNFSSFEFSIFNKWGEIFFQTNDPLQKWTGNSKNNSQYFVPNGIYVWKLIATPDELIDNGTPITLTGIVNLIR
jgi:gliding motility-associated-like protein